MPTDFVSKEVTSDGHFKRQKNRFTTPFGNKEGQLPVEPGRYRLLVSYACPWAHRQLIALRLLGLEDVISIGVVDPIRPTGLGRTDWAFALDPEGKDPVLGISYLSEAYKKADPTYQGRFTVPAVVDLQTGKVVNNDYAQLPHYWETVWSDYHKHDAPDLYPKDLREEIDLLNDIIFHDVNNGVYKAGFATSQSAYEEAFDLVFARLEELEERLSHSRYLFGSQITDSDIRLYVTLARFDAAYYNGFKLNQKRLIDYPNLWNYARELYQIEAFGATTNFNHIKKHYHLSALENQYQLVPKGPDESLWDIPSTRASQFKENEAGPKRDKGF